jgi:putative sterol carrier protein
MPSIYTSDWYHALKDLLNVHPEIERSAPRGAYKLLLVIRGDGRSPYVAAGEELLFSIHLDDGRCSDYIQLDSTVPRKGFDFVFEFPAAVYEGVAAGIVDPVRAGLEGTIRITGDMRVLIRHAELVNVLHQVYAREVVTDWPRGRPPYAAPAVSEAPA